MSRAMHNQGCLASTSASRRFDWYLFADYSGDKAARNQKKSIAVWMADQHTAPFPVRGEFTRDLLRGFLVSFLRFATVAGARVIWGVDHQWSWPRQLWRLAGVPRRHATWRARLAWLTAPTNGLPALGSSVQVDAYVEGFNRFCEGGHADRGPFYRVCGKHPPKIGSQIPARYRHLHRRLRLTEIYCGEGSPATALGDRRAVGGQTVCGLPQINALLADCGRLGLPVACWPFDSPSIQDGAYVGAHVGIEIYPRYYSDTGPIPRAAHASQHDRDAWRSCRYFRDQDLSGNLGNLLNLNRLSSAVRRAAAVEGWIAGVPW